MSDEPTADIIETVRNDLIQLTTLPNSDETITQRIIDNINKFEYDPSLLDKNLPLLIGNIISGKLLVLITEYNKNKLIKPLFTDLSKIYYYFNKIFNWKKIARLLKVDIHILNDIIDILTTINSNNPHMEIWHANYLLLSWLYTVLLSPFKFNQNNLDIEIIALIESSSFNENDFFQPIISNIIAELYYKNKNLFNFYYQKKYDNNALLSYNYFFKKIIQNYNTLENENFLDDNEFLIENIIDTVLIENSNNTKINKLTGEKEQHIIAKIMPKFFFIELYHENWSSLEYIISWYLLNLNSTFTELRFSIAHSFRKVIDIITKYMETDIAVQLIESKIIDETINMVSDAGYFSDSIDIDKLHSNLIIIAEISPFVIENISLSSLKKIIHTILPFTFKFQLLNNQNIVSLKGNQIKDATNFICWSLIRDRNLKRIVMNEESDKGEVPLLQLLYDTILLNLLMNSLFDKDFIIRKSSNAALQEFLGRIKDISQGSNLYTSIDSMTIMKLIEIKFNDLNLSYKENLITLYEVFQYGSTHQRGLPDPFFQMIIDWFIHYNILINSDLQIVKMSIESIKMLTETLTSINSNILIFDNIKGLVTGDNVISPESPLKCARLLYLITETDPLSNKISNGVRTKLYEDVISSNYHIVKINEDYFKFLSILKHWNVQIYGDGKFTIDENMVNFFFNNVASSTQTANSSIWFDDISNLFSDLVIYATSEDDSCFSSQNAKHDFFNKYQKYITFNNELICSPLPILPSELFLSLFEKYKNSMSCQCKAVMIKSMTNHFKDMIHPNFIQSEIEESGDTPFIDMICEFLNDHTITEQGDVGRLVREQACYLLDKHLIDFPPFAKDKFGIRLLYLMAEPSNEISYLSLKILREKYVPHFKMDHSPNHHTLCILEIRDEYFATSRTCIAADFKRERITFWKHFATRGGAFRSTDEQLSSCLDDFIIWYEDKDRTEEENIIIFHELINSIPSAATILNELDKREKSNIITTATLCINLLTRLISSNAVFYTTNWEGILIKFHNLLILNGSTMLRVTILKFLPFLSLVHSFTNEKLENTVFVNKIINKLFNVVKKYKNQKDKNSFARTALQSLTQIYLENDDLNKIDKLKTLVKSNFSEDDLDAFDFYIQA
ncbi:hypothetical protein C6P45_004122 [Maudiozyma exigua]|uniref:Tubulin-folding cofactor D ARM repeats domain-containing protein n=1 Tax=Maudiozyma exigua TaxID=34358 RepID=A0A9P7BBH6_MAUEX|nr:hypothetical protein C6P45_004122 [Kazachstania exigua]